jgi:hypothetical protein
LIVSHPRRTKAEKSGVQSQQRLQSARVHIGEERGETLGEIDTRHRDENGEISRKHGNTLIRTLRKTYGPGFVGGELLLQVVIYAKFSKIG